MDIKLKRSGTMLALLAAGVLALSACQTGGTQPPEEEGFGALGVVELTAPGRAAQVNAGLRRLGVRGAARQYFALHATLDVRHSAAWNEQVLRPLIAEDPERRLSLKQAGFLTRDARAKERKKYGQAGARRRFQFSKR